ncbi:reverse transcriptase [Quillaja saponaria]|uniref:Reverse transcriptase n=1 Tax=Quillaja saponaria TaxID=32244 RepID=A0AAD7QBC7_QUISA|nr:reverse transcriptase [Quillaja saponaria]
MDVEKEVAEKDMEDTEDWGEDDVTEVEDGISTIRLSREEEREIRKPWRNTLIFKLMGRSIGYNFLLKKLSQMWQPTEPLEIVDIGNEYFVVKLARVEDRIKALEGGPWMIPDHYLTVQQWRPNFDPYDAHIDKEIIGILEPQISGDQALRVIKKLGYENFHVQEAQGFSGGLWLLWNETTIKVHVLSSGRQHIHCQVVEEFTSSWLSTLVYVNPRDDLKEELWRDMRSLAGGAIKQWCVIGDFNEIAGADEKKGGAAVTKVYKVY